MHYKQSGEMKGDLNGLIYEKFNISLVLQMITWEHLSKAVVSACMLINFCVTGCIYSLQHKIKLKFYFYFPRETEFIFTTWILLLLLSDIPDFWTSKIVEVCI